MPDACDIHGPVATHKIKLNVLNARLEDRNFLYFVLVAVLSMTSYELVVEMSNHSPHDSLHQNL